MLALAAEVTSQSPRPGPGGVRSRVETTQGAPSLRRSQEKLARWDEMRPWGTCQGPGDIIPPPSDFELQLAELAGLSLSRSCQARTRFRTSRVLCRGQGGGGEAPGTAPRVHFQQASTLASDWRQGQDHLGLCSHWSRRARAAHNDVTAQWSRDLASAMLDWITQSCADE